MLNYLLMAGFLLLQGCNDSSAPKKLPKKTTTEEETGGTSVKIGSLSFTTANSTSLQQSTTSGVTGTGSALATTAISAIKTNKHFAFTGKINEGGYIKLSAFSTSALQSGVEIQFKVLSGKLKLLVGGRDLSTKVTSIAATSSLNIGADIHNEEANPHVLIWINTASKTESNALVNSEKDSLNIAAGSGSRWGFDISSATLSAATISAPVFVEE